MAKAEIKIAMERCKGCDICITFCPSHCLEIKDFKVHVKDIELCTACNQCELRCPDFAISVHKIGGKGE